MPQSRTESSQVDGSRVYVRAFLIAGVIIPIVLHVIASKAMPWWPDTVSMGIAFGVVAVVVVWKTRKEHDLNRRHGVESTPQSTPQPVCTSLRRSQREMTVPWEPVRASAALR